MPVFVLSFVLSLVGIIQVCCYKKNTHTQSFLHKKKEEKRKKESSPSIACGRPTTLAGSAPHTYLGWRGPGEPLEAARVAGVDADAERQNP